MSIVLATFIVPVGTVSVYRSAAASWSSGEGMFKTPLTDGSTITHYISSGAISSEVYSLLNDPAAFAQEVNRITGGSYTVNDMQSLREAMEIVLLESESVDETLSRLGLYRYVEDEV